MSEHSAPRPAGDLAGLSERAKKPSLRPPGETAWLAYHTMFAVKSANWDDLDTGTKVLWSCAEQSIFETLCNEREQCIATLTPAAPRPAPTEEEIEAILRQAIDLRSADGPFEIADWGPQIEGHRQAARTILALFRDADRGGEEGAR